MSRNRFFPDAAVCHDRRRIELSSRLRRPFQTFPRYTDWNSPVQFLARSGMSLAFVPRLVALKARLSGLHHKSRSPSGATFGHLGVQVWARRVWVPACCGFCCPGTWRRRDDQADRRTSADDKACFCPYQSFLACRKVGWVRKRGKPKLVSSDGLPRTARAVSWSSWFPPRCPSWRGQVVVVIVVAFHRLHRGR